MHASCTSSHMWLKMPLSCFLLDRPHHKCFKGQPSPLADTCLPPLLGPPSDHLLTTLDPLVDAAAYVTCMCQVQYDCLRILLVQSCLFAGPNLALYRLSAKRQRSRIRRDQEASPDASTEEPGRPPPSAMRAGWSLACSQTCISPWSWLC